MHKTKRERERQREEASARKIMTVHMYYKKNRGLAFSKMRLGLFGMANANE